MKGSNFYKVNIHFFCTFLDFLAIYFLLKLKLFRHIHTRMNIYLEMPPKIGKKVGIHFYENTPFEINLPLAFSKLRCNQIKLSLTFPSNQVPVNKNQNHTVLRVADNYLHWSDGEIFVFDDSFDHEVWHSNENNEARIVLIMDLWHPQLSAEKRASLPAIQSNVVK